jgi:hypothetical protein
MLKQEKMRTGPALLIGIDRYANAPDLRGCKNDVKLLWTVLQPYVFDREKITRLIDEAATRQAILAELDRLLQIAGPDETILVHFSGWSMRVPRETADPDGIIRPWMPATRGSYVVEKSSLRPAKVRPRIIPPDDETAARWVTALLPHDWDGTPATAITYDELRAWLARAAGHSLVLIFDAPYAGGLLEETAAALGGHVFMAASRADELCEEAPTATGVYQGAFTYYLAQALLEAKEGATYHDVFSKVSARVAAWFPHQQPQIEGAIDQLLFAGSQPAGTQPVIVTKRDGDEVILGVGAARGATVQSQWAIYPIGTPEPTSTIGRLGLVEITSVQATEAKARILSEVGRNVIDPWAVAVEEAHSFGDMRLVVRVEAPSEHLRERDALLKLLLGSDLLRLAEAGAGPDSPDITVHLLPPRNAAAEDEPVPELQEVDEPTWAVVDRASMLVAAVSTTDYSAPYLVRDELESLSRYRNVLGLRNPNPNSPLAGKVHFVLLRQGSGGGWSPTEAGRQGEIPTFYEGDQIAFRIVNEHSGPVWVGVLDFGLDRNMSMIFPIQGPSEQIDPGTAVEAGTHPGDEILLYLADDTRAAGDVGGPDHNVISGIETFKLFATAYPTDLGRLRLQEGGRGAFSSRGEGTALWQLLDLALTGVGSREPKPVQLPPDQEWTTAECTFELRAKR